MWQDTVVVPASFGKIGRLDLGYPFVPGKQLWFRSIDDWMNLLSFRLVKRVVPSFPPSPMAGVAQLERWLWEPDVAGSNPVSPTIFLNPSRVGNWLNTFLLEHQFRSQ